MCLHLCHITHPLEQGRRTYRTATRDILVYKVLRDPGKNGGLAPYRDCDWQFGKPRSYQRLRQSVGASIYHDTVDSGLHAFTSLYTAKSRANSLTGHNNWTATFKVFYAVIPKGSRLYFGSKSDIVATDMVVYKNRAALIAARGPIGKGVKKIKIAT